MQQTKYENRLVLNFLYCYDSNYHIMLNIGFEKGMLKGCVKGSKYYETLKGALFPTVIL